MSLPAPVVITSCTARKRHAADPFTLAGLDSAATVAELASSWRSRLARAEATYDVTRLYGGRAFGEALKAAAAVGADLYVVSAGLGLVEGGARVPAYDLTVSVKGGDLDVALRRLAVTPADWWSALNGPLGVAHVVARSRAPVLMALPANYLEMLGSDLAEVSDRDAPRVRILTSELGAQKVPEQLRDSVLPYDDRLEAVPGWAGTRSDFAQRALGHFVTILKGHRLDLVSARAAVIQALSSLQTPTRPSGLRLDDDGLRDWIRMNWGRCGGSTSRLLTELRHGAGLACEQGRFAALCREIRESLRGALNAS